MTINYTPLNNPLNSAPQSPINLIYADHDPTSTDNTYVIGTEWQNTTSKEFFKLASNSYNGVVGNAFWDLFSSPVANEITQITGNTGIVTPTDGNVTIQGTSTSGIVSLASGDTLTLGMNSPFVGDFTFRSVTSADTELLVVENTSNTASSAAQVKINVAGATADDPTIQFNVNGVTTWTSGVDNSASDAFKISSSTALGTNDRLAISTTGAMTVNNAFTLPNADGAANTFLKTNGSGSVTWSATSNIGRVNVIAFTSSGTYTPTAGMEYCIIEGVGGGAGGGGVAATGVNQIAAGGGGSSGVPGKAVFTAAQIGASQTVTIGAGGAGGVGNATGSNGGATSVGALISLAGGIGGGGAGTAGVTGAPGGSPQSSVVTLSAGGSTFTFYGEGGHCSYGQSNLVISGAGGNTLYGAGGGCLAAANGSSVGAAGRNGGGGGGAYSVNSSAQEDGGAGGDGYVIITEFI